MSRIGSVLHLHLSLVKTAKECYHCGVEFHSTEEMKSHPQRCDRMKNARSIGQVNLNDFNDDVHLTQKDTYSKPRQKRKKAQPKIGEIL